MNHRLYRSPDDRVLAGVAGGMAETYELDPALVRVGWALIILFSGGVFLIIYIIMALVVPLRPMGMTLWASAPGGAAGDPGVGGVGAGGPTQSSMPGYPPPSGYGPPPGSRPPHHHRNSPFGPIIIGLILIVVGGFFLARQFIPALNFGLIWPVVAIAGGLLLVVAAFLRQRPTQ